MKAPGTHFRGRAHPAGSAAGPGLVLPEPLSLWGGLNPHTGAIIDQRHPSHGAIVAGKVMVMPAGRGSSSASSILLQAVMEGTAPAAIVLQEIDPILSLGAIVAQEMYGKAPPVVTLDPEDYRALCEAARSGAVVSVRKDGTVAVQPH